MSSPPLSQADLDLRLVRYFTVVARHQNFGRAAEALHIAQPSLSRQIHRLEELLGARLLDRTSRGSHLTEAGRVFLAQAEELLRVADQAAIRTRAAAHPNSVTIGYASDLIITPAVRDLREKWPAAEVQTLHLDWNEPHSALLDGRVDAAVARPPLMTEGLSITVLYREDRVLVVPRSHRLAGRDSVSLEDIADEPVPRLADEAWNAFWRIEERPGGNRPPDGPLVGAVEDKYELIAGGQAVAIAPAGIQGSALRQDLITIPLEGVEQSEVVLLTREDDRNPLVSAFRLSAKAHLTGGAADVPG